MKSEVKTPVLVGIIVIFVGCLIAFMVKYMGNVGSLDHGQVSYTPGVPPWAEKDPAKKESMRKLGLEMRENSQAAGHGPQGLGHP